MSNSEENFQIKRLPELLKSQLSPDQFFRSAKISRLTAPGENYGSIMLRVDVTLVNRRTGMEEMLYAVAKILPESEEFRKVFEVENTVKSEINFYEVIIPTLQNFQRELGITEVIDCFSKCYATRKTLREDADIVDEDSVILLKNMKANGFQNVDRFKGFDLDTAKLILRDLALFHAVPLALKMKHPKTFADKIVANCYKSKQENQTDGMMSKIIKAVLMENDDCPQVATDLISMHIERPPSKEPFVTLIHKDLWVNNTMQKFVEGRAVANKLVDFQMYDYGSPALDIFFFLWTSIPKVTLESNLDHLIEYYHEHFVHVLAQHGCDIEPFSYEKLLEEIKSHAEFLFARCLFFILIVVHAKKGAPPPDRDNMPSIEEIVKELPLVAKEKVRYMAKECVRRGWLGSE